MTEMIGTSDQFRNLCRACLSRDNCTYDIFEGKCSNEQTYCKILTECAPVQVSKNDSLPSSICYSCAMYLETFVAFRTKCIESEYTLKRYLVRTNDGRNTYATINVKSEIEADVGRSNTDAENLLLYRSLQESVSIKEDLDGSTPKVVRSGTVGLVGNLSRERSLDGGAFAFQSTAKKKPDREKDARPIHACPTCGRPFNRKSNLKRHMKIHTGEKPYRCDLCFKTFNENWNLKVHKEIHLESDIHANGLATATRTADGSIDVGHERSEAYECRVCEVGFGSKGDLDDHLKRHVRKRPYKCDFCDKAFLRNQHLVIHRRSHTGERPFVCGTCGKSFAGKCHLTTHAYNHTKRRPYACDRCDKSFTWNVHLADHKRVHTGEKPFTCRVCGKDFTRKSQLTAHSHVHGDEKRYGCDTCGKAFARRQHLAVHAETHSGEKPFALKRQLVIHARKHDGKKSDRSILVDRRRTHASEKDSTCGRTFRNDPYPIGGHRKHRRGQRNRPRVESRGPTETTMNTETFVKTERRTPTPLDEPTANVSQLNIEHVEIKNEVVEDLEADDRVENPLENHPSRRYCRTGDTNRPAKTNA